MKAALALALFALSNQGNPTVNTGYQGAPIYSNQQPMMGGGIIATPMMMGGPMMGGPMMRAFLG